MYHLSKFLLEFFGWSFSSAGPMPQKCILLAAPHTSNWDFPLMIVYGFRLKLRYYWLGKHTLFRWPLGYLMYWLGGIPVDRKKKNAYVNHLAERINKKEQCILIIPPEGTRSKTEYWKSGFIHIAKGACVPIIFGNLNYKSKSLKFSDV